MLTIGINLGTGFERDRSLYEQIELSAELLRFIAPLGTYHELRVPHRWLVAPPVLEPIPLLARLAPDAAPMRLMVSVMKPPLHNPVELAHQVVTLDHICNGRLDFGVGLGWPQEEFEAAGFPQRLRVPRFLESLRLMKQLWTGDEVTFEGRFWSVHGVRMGMTPVQKPYPPIWVGAHRVPASERAARIADGLVFASQTNWEDVATNAAAYQAELARVGRAGRVGVEREISLAPTYEAAAAVAIQKRVARASAFMNTRDRQGSPVVHTADAPGIDPRDWAIVGTPDDCLEQIGRWRERTGFDYVGLALANWPKEQAARKEALQYLSEAVLQRLVSDHA
jgi:alkanesulfonate monooxygenase SsuD/methylene tetrahydromethanopterin reductase-like flavin-dependent oxidoreductase (luciferase family)